MPDLGLNGGSGPQGTPLFPADTSQTSDTSGSGGDTGSGGSHTSSGPVNIPPGALSNSPQWLIDSSYLNANLGLDSSDLQRMIDTANARYGLSSQEIANSLQNAQRGVTYDLANRQATESGDNAFYHNQASLLASFQQQGAQIDLQDYLAGAQAAFAHQSLDTQHSLSQDWLNNYYQMVQYYTNLAGGGAPVAPPPPQPGAPSA